MLPDALVSTDWLAEHLTDPGLRILDASWYLPQSGRDARREYEAAHIPGAVFFSLDAVSDPESPLPHMLPAPGKFEKDAGALGVGTGHDVVVYDGSGINLSAPRAWWMFRVFGHERVAVLDGGFPRWLHQARPLESGSPAPPITTFEARFQSQMVESLDAVRSALTGGHAQVLDARSAGRFHAREPEPRPGLRGGHMPGSLNLPYQDLLAPDGTMLKGEALRARFAAAGVDLTQPVITTCGSGVTACVLALGLHLLGHDAAVYDGSWAEWGGRADTAVEP